MSNDPVEQFFTAQDEIMARSQYRVEIAEAHKILKALFKAAGIRAEADVRMIHASRTVGTHQIDPEILLVARLVDMGIDPTEANYETILDCMTSKELAMVPWCAGQLVGWIQQTPGASAAMVAQRYRQIGNRARIYFYRKHKYNPEDSPLPEQPITLEQARAYVKKLSSDVGQPTLFDSED